MSVSGRTRTLWTCEDCGDSGMSILVHQCPQCQHHRCTRCDVYPQKGIKYYDSSVPVAHECKVLKNDSMPKVLLPQSSSVSLLSPSHPISATPERNRQGLKDLDVDGGIAPPPLAETPELIMASDIVSSSSYSTPSTEVILTPTSTQEYNISSRSFSHQDYTDSEIGFDTNDAESVEDMTDDERTTDYYQDAIDILDSHLFSILRHDPELVSRLIPQIHAQLQLGFETEREIYTASPSCRPSAVLEADGDSGPSTSTQSTSTPCTSTASTSTTSKFTPDNGSSCSGATSNKRGRERDESKDRGDKSGSSRRRRFRDRSAVPPYLYACHFHKKDPARYCPSRDRNFNICLGRGKTVLRRMKEHYLKAHRPAQCERCYFIFKDRDELKNHRQAESPCQNQPHELKEGIDDSQWAKIEPKFHVQRKLSPLQKKQNDFDKWFEIWDILFPNVPRPIDPWVGIVPIPLNTLPNDTEGLLTSFNTIIELDVERGVFQLDNEVHQRYERAFRLTLQTQVAALAPTLSFDHSFPSVNELCIEPIEHPSREQTAVETLENCSGELVSSQIAPNHLMGHYQEYSSPILDTHFIQSSSWHFDITGDPYVSQSSNESMPQMSNASNISPFFGSLIDLRGTSTTELHLAESASPRCQSEVMSLEERSIEHLVASNTEQSQDCEPLEDPEFAAGSYSDRLQDNLLPFDVNNREFDYSSETLTKILEMENENPAVSIV